MQIIASMWQKAVMEAAAGETTPLEDISYGDVAVAEDGTVAFLDYTETDYVRLQLWTRTEAHIHFRLKCLQKMPLYQLQHLTVTNS